jgi:pilus assembly protein TadC
MNAETLRLLLAVTLIAMVVLAVFYLRRPPITFSQYMLWGLFALLVPALGPFLVIAASRHRRPPRRSSRIVRR